MGHRSHQGRNTAGRLWHRLDRAAAAINPFLMVVAIGLGVLTVISFVGLLVTMPITRGNPNGTAAVSPSTGSVGAAGPIAIDAARSGG